jgi:hypothetical protein
VNRSNPMPGTARILTDCSLEKALPPGYRRFRTGNPRDTSEGGHQAFE